MNSGKRYWSRIGRFALGLGFLSACHLSPSLQPTAIQPLGNNQVQTALPATEDRSSDGRRWVYAKLDEKAASYHLLDGECPPDPYGRPVVADNVNYDIWRYGGPESGEPNLACAYELGANSGGTARWVGIWTSRTVLAVYRRQIYFNDTPDQWFYLGTQTYAPLPGESPDPNPSSDPSPSPSDSPTPSEPPTPTPAPSQNPSSPPSASPSSLPSSDPLPSSNPSPTEPPCYADFRAQEGFSPNGDGKFDQLSIEVSSGCAWVISVDGRSGVVKSGKGDMSFSWDGSLGNRQKSLPDGKYTLRLKIGSGKGRIEKTAKIILDTTGPEVKLSLDEKISSKVLRPNPVLVLNINDELSECDGVNSIEKFEFGKRSDNVNQKVYDVDPFSGMGLKRFEKGSGDYEYKFKYETPVVDDSVFLPRDQVLAIRISDKLGNSREDKLKLRVSYPTRYKPSVPSDFCLVPRYELPADDDEGGVLYSVLASDNQIDYTEFGNCSLETRIKVWRDNKATFALITVAGVCLAFPDAAAPAVFERVAPIIGVNGARLVANAVEFMADFFLDETGALFLRPVTVARYGTTFKLSPDRMSLISPAGLIYGKDKKFGNRLVHVEQHLYPMAKQALGSSGKHSVFNCYKHELVSLIDEAWRKRKRKFTDGGMDIWEVEMGRPIGRGPDPINMSGANPEYMVKIVCKPGTHEIVTAYPISTHDPKYYLP